MSTRLTASRSTKSRRWSPRYRGCRTCRAGVRPSDLFVERAWRSDPLRSDREQRATVADISPGWTACPWRSSWRRTGTNAQPERCCPTWTAAPPSRVTRPGLPERQRTIAAQSRGATTCWRRRRGGYSPGSRYSPGGVRWRVLTQSPIPVTSACRCSKGLARWSARACCASRQQLAASRVSACSRPSSNTPATDSEPISTEMPPTSAWPSSSGHSLRRQSHI